MRTKRILYDGVFYRSGYESAIAKTNKTKGLIYEKTKIRYQEINNRIYTPDWEIPAGISCTGESIFIEAKGIFSVGDRKKLLAIKKQHNLDIRLLFQRSTLKLSPKSKKSKTYSEWCETHGILYAEGYKIPNEWFR
jgi:hypothetical protein